jgi:hypothetical protein
MAGTREWQKSSFSGGEDGDNCVELQPRGRRGIAIRESDAPGRVLATSPALLAGLIRHLKAVG